MARQARMIAVQDTRELGAPSPAQRRQELAALRADQDTIAAQGEAPRRRAGRPPNAPTPAQGDLLRAYRAADAAAQAAKLAARQARQACIDAGIPVYKL
jgi:hypothetical protein